jgi:hypothetical protein
VREAHLRSGQSRFLGSPQGYEKRATGRVDPARRVQESHWVTFSYLEGMRLKLQISVQELRDARKRRATAMRSVFVACFTPASISSNLPDSTCSPRSVVISKTAGAVEIDQRALGGRSRRSKAGSGGSQCTTESTVTHRTLVKCPKRLKNNVALPIASRGTSAVTTTYQNRNAAVTLPRCEISHDPFLQRLTCDWPAEVLDLFNHLAWGLSIDCQSTTTTERLRSVFCRTIRPQLFAGPGGSTTLTSLSLRESASEPVYK